MKLTSLLHVVDKLQQAGKIENLQKVCAVFRCVERENDLQNGRMIFLYKQTKHITEFVTDINP